MEMFKHRGFGISDGENTDDYTFGVFTGGPDVLPLLYGEMKGDLTQCNYQRDLRDIRGYRSIPLKTPKIGICRGAQFLNVMSGGSLAQHVDRHAIKGTHMMSCDWTQEHIPVTSTHHQMMLPAENGWVMGRAGESCIKHIGNAVVQIPDRARTNELEWDDCEVVYYDNTESLCVQGHPEYEGCDEFEEYFFDCIEMLFSTELKEARSGKVMI